MTSLINLEQYRKPTSQFGGYVIECAKDKAIYTGISHNLDQRIGQHVVGNSLSAEFVRMYGGPTRVLELYFCDTEKQARQWERSTSEQLYATYKDRPVYYIGWYRPIKRAMCPVIKTGRKHKQTQAGMLALDAWLKRGSKQRDA